VFQFKSFLNIFITGMIVISGFLFFSNDASATSQWSRKYNTSCQTCHTSFPRLNYYGERFMKNGMQDPDQEVSDGGVYRKFTKGRMDLGALGDVFGVRINFQPFYFRNKNIPVNQSKKHRFDIGKFNWIQLFSAGSITKDVSFFNELEINDAGTVKHGWFILGFHNLWDSKLVNLQIGKISPVEWTSFSNRLRIFPEVTGIVDKITASYAGSSQDDNVNISSSQAGINYYGYKGPVIWTLGIGNGKNASDKNQFKNFWGSLRFEIPKEGSNWQGSSVSFFAYSGTDTRNSASTSLAQIKNRFTRIQPSFNVRYKEWDIIGSVHYADENNWTLNAGTAQPENYWGGTALVSKMIQDKYQVGLQYDHVEQDHKTETVTTNIEHQRLVAHTSYLMRENLNLILTGMWKGKGDQNNTDNSLFVTIRSMF